MDKPVNLTAAELAEIDARVAAATPGPWENGGMAVISLTFDHEANIYPPDTMKSHGFQFGGPVAVVNWPGEGGKPDGGVAAFISAARTDIPRLRQHIERQASYLSDLREVHEALKRTTAEQLALKGAEIERLKSRRVSVHIGTGVLTHDLVWCECGRGLSRNGKWIYCPSCGARIDQDSYIGACATAERNGAQHFSHHDADLVNELSEAQRKLGEAREALAGMVPLARKLFNNTVAAAHERGTPLQPAGVTFEDLKFVQAALADTEEPKP